MKAEVNPRDLRLAVGVDTVANLARQYPGYHFAVNGCYFGPQMQVWSPLAKDGKLLCPNYVDRGHPYLAVKGDKAWFGRGIPDAKGVDFALGGGPMLLKNGKPASRVAGENYDAEVSAGETRVRNRTVVGITPKGTAVVLALNGTFADCRKALLEAGCTDGMNLDGGSSTQWVENNVTVYGTPRKVVSALVAVQGERRYRVYVDPSHQKENVGESVAYGGKVTYNEAIICQVYALALCEDLMKKGIEVRMSGQDMSLAQIAADANKWGADFFISLHTNAADKPSTHGVSTWIVKRGGRAEQAAKLIHAAMLKLGYADAGIHEENFYVLRETAMPAVLVEIDFHSNSEAVLRLMDEDRINDVARALADAIEAHKG